MSLTALQYAEKQKYVVGLRICSCSCERLMWMMIELFFPLTRESKFFGFLFATYLAEFSFFYVLYSKLRYCYYFAPSVVVQSSPNLCVLKSVKRRFLLLRRPKLRRSKILLIMMRKCNYISNEIDGALVLGPQEVSNRRRSKCS